MRHLLSYRPIVWNFYLKSVDISKCYARKQRSCFFEAQIVYCLTAVGVCLELRAVPYWSSYSRSRLALHTITTSKYFDLAISVVIGINVVTMAMEYHMMPQVRARLQKTSDRLNVSDMINKDKDFTTPMYNSDSVLIKVRLWVFSVLLRLNDYTASVSAAAHARSFGVHCVSFQELRYALKVCNFFFTSVFILEAAAKIISQGFLRYFSDRLLPFDCCSVIELTWHTYCHESITNSSNILLQH